MDNEKELERLIQESARLAENAITSRTKDLYASDFRKFAKWCQSLGCTALPATPETVAAYLAKCRESDLAVSTVARYLTSINFYHDLAGQESPTKTESVKKPFVGIQREKGVAQKKVKPLSFDQLVRIVDCLGSSIVGLRDAAILTLGWMAALRRSEIVALNREDLESVDEGIIVRVRRSKTDQTAEGHSVGIPFGSDKFCPVTVIRRWFIVAQIKQGPLFFRLPRGASSQLFLKRQKQPSALNDRSVAIIIKRSMELAGYDSIGFSGHSLRAGFCTQAAKAGIPEWAIMRHTGHRKHETVQGYIREGSMFETNPLSVVLELAREPREEFSAQRYPQLASLEPPPEDLEADGPESGGGAHDTEVSAQADTEH